MQRTVEFRKLSSLELAQRLECEATIELEISEKYGPQDGCLCGSC